MNGKHFKYNVVKPELFIIYLYFYILLLFIYFYYFSVPPLKTLLLLSEFPAFLKFATIQPIA